MIYIDYRKRKIAVRVICIVLSLAAGVCLGFYLSRPESGFKKVENGKNRFVVQSRLENVVLEEIVNADGSSSDTYMASRENIFRGIWERYNPEKEIVSKEENKRERVEYKNESTIVKKISPEQRPSEDNYLPEQGTLENDDQSTQAELKDDNAVVPEEESDPGETGPVKTEPVKTEPVKTEPVKTEPVKTEPVKSKPVKSEPVKTEPKKSKPVKSEPKKTEPKKKKPEKSEPIKEILTEKYGWVRYRDTLEGGKPGREILTKDGWVKYD